MKSLYGSITRSAMRSLSYVTVAMLPPVQAVAPQPPALVHEAESFLPVSSSSTVGAVGSVMCQHDPEQRHGGNDMADVLYVGLQDDDKIVSFDIDGSAGKLVPRTERPAAGAPSVFAVSPDRRVLYVGYRGTPGIESCRIDPAGGALTSLGRVTTEHPPTYLAPDRAGKYLLSAYYQGAYAAVHPLGSDGAVSGPALDRQNTEPGAHSILDLV